MGNKRSIYKQSVFVYLAYISRVAPIDRMKYEIHILLGQVYTKFENHYNSYLMEDAEDKQKKLSKML